ncbi:DUF2913 family protein [Vibrio chagasii]|uniref:DUF2913 family protein n=1 Tax=Vibrio chagasii TaxID=170679 RepID=A0A7V7TI05_9VIBR|nr:DUF2913 family protein [Vibrio chagasii]KAB0482430.1 DUF2913 family protein [Vibrio chagasii]
MSKNLKHYQALDMLVTNALLTLYCTMSNKGGYWTTKRRNELLVKCIKPKLKMKQFATCKNEIKTMICIGRDAVGNLEKKLWDVNALNLDYQSKFSQADELYIMFSSLHEKHKFPSMMNNTSQYKEMDTLYITQEDIEDVFDGVNNQIKPLPLTVKTNRLNELIRAVEENGTYHVEAGDVNEDGLTSFLLHRAS